tara:strand:- start:2705 stop:5359 length:2655 start_codon:yes stop_codon:yes gene_type:complete
MEVAFEPFSPWHWLVSTMVLMMTVIVLTRGLKDRWRIISRRPLFRAGCVLLTVAAGILFMVASWNPTKRSNPEDTFIHLVVVMDGSNSVLNSEDSLGAIKEKLLAIMPVEADSSNLVVSLATIADGVKVVEERITLQEATARIKTLASEDFPPASETSVEKGLQRAQSLIRASGGAGMVLLCSDGHQTQGDALKVAEALAREGVKVHVAPLEGKRTPIKLSAAYLPKSVESGAEVNARVVIKSEAESKTFSTLGFALNKGLPESAFFQTELLSSMEKTIPRTGIVFASVPLRFRGLGLQYFDATLDAKEVGFHQRRLFTMVTRPPYILSVGADHQWTQAIDPEIATIKQLSPQELNAKENRSFSAYDAIVVNAVKATDFNSQVLERIAYAVENMGVGLLLINGDHKPLEETDPTVLLSYADTPVDRVLPVSAKPRPFQEKPPPKQVFMLIDASGSMQGERMACAKRIAKHIVNNLLRPEDLLDLVVFSDTDQELLRDEKMTDSGKAKAVKAINGIWIGGGTNPRSALMRIANKKIKNGGMIFLSDGGFAPEAIKVRPDCKATIIEIDGFAQNRHIMDQLGDLFVVQTDFNPAGMTIPYFEPEKRDNFFTFGSFTPASMASVLGDRMLEDPGLEMEGTAVSYIREEAQLVFVRPKETDPLLAYRKAFNGDAGVLTSAFPQSWIDHPEGKKAITDWVLRVIPFTHRDRYFFEVQDLGEDLQLDLTLASAPHAPKPKVNSISCKVKLLSTGETVGGVMQPTMDNSGSDFTRKISLNRTDYAQGAYLFIEEEKGEEVISRVQRIPLLVPPRLDHVAKATDEDNSFGTNEKLLKELQAAGNGKYLDPPSVLQPPTNQDFIDVGEPYWPFLFSAGLTFYLFAFALQRIDP